jgi:hypothetical protein
MEQIDRSTSSANQHKNLLDYCAYYCQVQIDPCSYFHNYTQADSEKIHNILNSFSLLLTLTGRFPVTYNISSIKQPNPIPLHGTHYYYYCYYVIIM